MTRMPISARLMANDGQINVESDAIKAHRLPPMIKRAIHFDTQVASELYWLGKQNDYSIESDFGPIRLPYPSVWMEWSVPKKVVVEGKLIDFNPTLVGCLLWEDHDDPDGNVGINTASLFAQQDSSCPPEMMPMTTRFLVDHEGRSIGGSLRRAYDKRIDLVDAERMQTVIGGNENVAYLALNLINCKNVTTRKAGAVNVRRSGSAKRRKEPRIDYHTIILPGTETSAPSPTRAGETQDLMPIHRVRGHFKTFTAEAPLLGRFTGTYWWGWQVRGNKKNGITVTDYEVVQ